MIFIVSGGLIYKEDYALKRNKHFQTVVLELKN
jgi:hypothetical protein